MKNAAVTQTYEDAELNRDGDTFFFLEILVSAVPIGPALYRDVETEIPVKHVRCERCDGRGTHDHPAFENGISADEWNGPDWDDDSREGYMSGRYDVRCSECDGARFVATPNLSGLPKDVRERVAEYLNDIADAEAESRHAAKMGY